MGLKWSDIDFEKSMIHLPAGITKGQKRRIVAMADVVQDHMKQVRRERPFEEMVMGDWKTFNKLRFEWDRLRCRISFGILPNGLKLHFHDLRHIYAQSLRDAGVPMADIQVFMGHSSIQVTENRYAQIGGRDAKDKVNKIAEIIRLDSKNIV